MSLETSNEALARYKEQVSDYRLRLANIRKLHRTSTHNSELCECCLEPHPCSTHRAADGINE